MSTQISFMKYRKLAVMFSVILLIISVGSLVKQGLNFGLDFTGGTLLELEYPNPVDTNEVRGRLEDAGIQNAVVQHFGKTTEIAIRIPPQEGDGQSDAKESLGAAGKQILAALEEGYEADQIELKRNEFVGPSFGEELRDDGGIALIVALGFMLLYIAVRFHYRFGFGAVAALFHDVIIVLGFFSLMQFSFDQSVLAAILAVIGYSLNDTIVVADRVRENFHDNLESDDTEGLIDLSLNQTLSRTIFTSLTTVLVLLALYFFGGESLRLFAVALLAGIFIGTYSSIYVASSLLVSLGVTPSDFKEPEVDELEDEMP